MGRRDEEDMTRSELAVALAALGQALAERVTIVRVIVDANGQEIGQRHRGHFQHQGELDHGSTTPTWPAPGHVHQP